MTNSMQQKLERLAIVAAQLNEASDQGNELIGRIEDDLAKTGVGVSTWLYDEKNRIALRSWYEDSGYKIDNWWALGYAKLETWCIAVREFEASEFQEGGFPEKTPPIPLLKASRLVRIGAVKHLEKLIENLTETALGHLQTTQSNNADLERLEKQTATMTHLHVINGKKSAPK